MKEITIPKGKTLRIKNIIFDINGTIQFKGKISSDLIELFQELKKVYDVFLVSSDTRGNLRFLAEKIGVEYIKITADDMTDAEAKNNELLKLGKETTVAVGNGNNDKLMLKNALLGIIIIGSEGASTKSMLNADVAFNNPQDVINFLLDDKAIVATLRK